MHGRAAQVRIHDQDALAVLGEDGGEVEKGGGFAFAGAAAQDGEGGPISFLRENRRLVRKHAIGLGVRTFRPVLQDEADILRDDAQDGGLQGPLDIVNGLDAGIQIFDEEGHADADQQPEEDSDGNDDKGFGADRVFVGARGVVNDDGLFVGLLVTRPVLRHRGGSNRPRRAVNFRLHPSDPRKRGWWHIPFGRWLWFRLLC